MLFKLRKLFLIITFNSCLFLFLVIGIQNSSKKSQINLLINETVPLPISFIVGTSFISGSILGWFININFEKKKNNF